MNLAKNIIALGRNIKFIFTQFVIKSRYKNDFNLDVKIIMIETMSVCNLRCEYCPNSLTERSSLKNNKKLDEKYFYKLIDELSRINYKGCICPSSYNEPLLDERLVSLITYVSEKLPSARIMLYTNGELLDEKRYEELVNAGVDQFVITNHTGIENKQVEKIIENKKNSDKTVITYHRHGLASYSNRGGSIKKFRQKIRIKRFIYCSNPLTMVTIDYNGDVLMCCDDYYGEVKFGNIKNDNLVDIWTKPDYQKVRRNIIRELSKIPICQRCRSIDITVRKDR